MARVIRHSERSEESVHHEMNAIAIINRHYQKSWLGQPEILRSAQNDDVTERGLLGGGQ